MSTSDAATANKSVSKIVDWKPAPIVNTKNWGQHITAPAPSPAKAAAQRCAPKRRASATAVSDVAAHTRTYKVQSICAFVDTSANSPPAVSRESVSETTASETKDSHPPGPLYAE